MRRALGLLARLLAPFLLTVTGCVPREAPPPAPAPTPTRALAPAPSAPLAADWRDWPVTPGNWVYRQDGRGSVALFGPAGADAALVLRCDAAQRRLFLSVAGAGAATATATVRTSSIARTLPLAPTGGDPPYLAAALAPTDPLLDAMGFSRGRFAIERLGIAPLVVPAWAEVERVTEDCRR